MMMTSSPAVKLVMAKLHIEDDALTPRNVLSRISYAKNQAQTPEQMRAQAVCPRYAQSGGHLRCLTRRF